MSVFRTFVFPRLLLWGVAVGVIYGLGAIQAQQTLVVDSPTLKAGAMMPRDYTPDGRNVSPPLTWSNVPAGTREFAVVCEDFDAGNPPPFVHWVIYKIPGTAKGLPENVPIDPSVAMPARRSSTAPSAKAAAPYSEAAHHPTTKSASALRRSI